MNQEEYKIKNNKEIMKNKPDIKIFVSHRIDMEAETIDNPLYVNVRCGAVYDKRENVDMLGDNTGDNISEKRESFNELTVMYWAWKNVEADYYGLCHYRRYLSFATQYHEINDLAKNGASVNSVVCDYISSNMIEKYNLNEEYMRNEISKYDIIKTNAIDFAKLSYKYCNNQFKTNKEQIEYTKDWHRIEDFETVRQIIEEKFTIYLKYYDEYMNSKYGYFYALFLMKKKYFNMFCEFLFGVLFELEKKNIDTTYLSIKQNRFYGTIGERLYGVFMLYVQDNFDVKVAEKQVIFIENPQKQKELLPFSKENNIPIVIRINDYYAPYFTVLLQSIIDNAYEKNNYDIIVLEHTVTKENKRIISEILQGKNNISVRYFNPEYLLEDVILPFKTELDSIEPYYSIFIPWLLPNYDKVLIIDCDTILLGDIAEIYNQDISAYLAGACKDIMHLGMYNINENGYVDYVKEELKLQKPYEYFNTKIMLLNTDKIRNSFNIKDIFNKVKTNKYNELEQDLFNNLLNGKVKYFDYKYSIISEVDTFINSRIEYAPKKENNAYRKAQANPFVINFNNYPKPWSNPNIPYSYKWWKIARKTPFYETILYRMTHEQSNHISFTKLDHFSRIMFPFKWLKRVHKIGYIRQIADKLLPHGTKRRKIFKKILFK